MARLEVPRLTHTCDATRILPQQHICPEHSLTASCANELLAERRCSQRRIDHRRSLEIGRLGGAEERRSLRRHPSTLAQSDQLIRRRALAALGQVDGLQSVPAFLQRRVLRRQEGTKNGRMVLRPDLIVQDWSVQRILTPESASRPLRDRPGGQRQTVLDLPRSLPSGTAVRSRRQSSRPREGPPVHGSRAVRPCRWAWPDSTPRTTTHVAPKRPGTVDDPYARCFSPGRGRGSRPSAISSPVGY